MDKKLLVSALLLITYIQLFAQEQQIVTDRPDQTEASSTVPKNSFQVESGLLFQEVGGIHSIRSLANNNLFRIGILTGLEIRIVSQLENYKIENPNGFMIVNREGFSDIQVGAKVQIVNKESFEIGFLSHVVFPTGSAFFTEEEFGSVNRLLITHNISDFFTLAYNVGFNFQESGNQEVLYSIALGFGITEKLSVFLEPYGTFFVDTDNIPENSIDAGATYLLRDNFQLDISLGTGIDYEMNFVSAGFSWLLARKPDTAQ